MDTRNTKIACAGSKTCADPEWGQGVWTPRPKKNHKNIGFLSNTGPDPLENHKATKPAFIVGSLSVRQQNAIYGVSLAGR